MPNRTLREGLLRSEAWNHVDVVEQLLFIRLVLIADDFGCYDGRESVIMARAYLNRFEPEEEFAGFLHRLHVAGLIIKYSNRGRPFIAIPQWSHDYRYRRLYPAPPINVDTRDIGYRSKYGKKIDWRNPEGFDEVSILLDLNGRAAAPQPPEWRRLSDYAPVTWKPSDKTPVTAVTEAPVTASPPQSLVCSSNDLETLKLRDSGTSMTSVPPSPQPAVTTPQSLPTAPPTNGKVGLNDKGEWAGVSDEQRLRWQGMFDALSIPDQLARAGAWLVAHAEERRLYTERGELEQYLIRWLLREDRERTGRARGSSDSQGKT